MSSTLKLLQQYAGGNYESDFFKFEDGKTHILRFYRFTVVDDAGKSSQELCAGRDVHWIDKKPYDCTGPGCEKCAGANKLLGSPMPADQKKGRDQSKKTDSEFVVIDVNNPIKFFILGAGFGLIQKLLLKIAEAGGWVADYPEQKDDPAIWAAFSAAMDKGVAKVTGPNGRDIVITYNKGKAAKTYTLVMRMDENKALPFPEDNTVLSPIAVRQKMAAGGKEGDN